MSWTPFLRDVAVGVDFLRTPNPKPSKQGQKTLIVTVNLRAKSAKFGSLDLLRLTNPEQTLKPSTKRA